jgi:hypothetical protein
MWCIKLSNYSEEPFKRFWSFGSYISQVTYSHIQLFQLMLSTIVHEQNEKVEYERERLLGTIAKKLMSLLAIPSILSRSYSTFPLYSWTTLIEIAVYRRRYLAFACFIV